MTSTTTTGTSIARLAQYEARLDKGLGFNDRNRETFGGSPTELCAAEGKSRERMGECRIIEQKETYTR